MTSPLASHYLQSAKTLGTSGMLPSLFARDKPDEIAVLSARGNRTWAELNSNANRLVDALYSAGIQATDHVAVLCPNVPEYVEIVAATLRGGFRLIPVNWHLKSEEVAYVVENSDAKALIAHADFAEVALQAGESPKLILRLSVGGPVSGFQPYEEALARADDADPAEPMHGLQMLYTSGTTGRPKGVYRPSPQIRAPHWGAATRKNFIPEADVSLCCGPAYHAALLGNSIIDPMISGVCNLLMEKFDAEGVLAAIERHRVTHVHMVATMFRRILSLPEDVRQRYDLSSLRYVLHGAAPTPPELKRAMLDWWGPIIHEYYGASEGTGGLHITAEEWLRKPGSVGCARSEIGMRIVDEQGADCKPNITGRLVFRHAPGGSFRYYKDDEKTASAELLGGLYFTVGDMGYLDEDGYLFLTGRSAECIISGGVNIYPQEVDNHLAEHPAVREVCAIGAPNEEWGEEVRAVVVLQPGFEGTPQLASELLEFIRPRLATFKLPRAFDFVESIPRSEAGKVLRGEVRAPYWAGRQKQI